VRSTRRRHGGGLDAVAVSTIGSVGMWSTPVALPFVQAGFGISRAEVSMPYTLAMVGFALGGVAMGRLCDRFGLVAAIMLGSLALSIVRMDTSP
jgi:MFS family permease